MQEESMNRKVQSIARPPPPPIPAGGAKTARSRAHLSLAAAEVASSPLKAAVFDHEVYVLPAGEWVRRRQAKEVLKRALTPPKRRPSWRWRNFQPRPSPLSIMSTV